MFEGFLLDWLRAAAPTSRSHLKFTSFLFFGTVKAMIDGVVEVPSVLGMILCYLDLWSQ